VTGVPNGAFVFSRSGNSRLTLRWYFRVASRLAVVPFPQYRTSAKWMEASSSLKATIFVPFISDTWNTPRPCYKPLPNCCLPGEIPDKIDEGKHAGDEDQNRPQ
jgi:hypothetical protein